MAKIPVRCQKSSIMVSPRKNDDSVLIIAGETSSDKYGALLVQAFNRLHRSILFFGIGGKHMADEGVELLFTVRDISLVGFEIVTHFFNLLKIFRRLDREINLKKGPPLPSLSTRLTLISASPKSLKKNQSPSFTL